MSVSPAPAAFTLHLQCATQRAIPHREVFARAARMALGERQAPAELTIRVVDEDESRRLNRRYRASDRATNVLAFGAEGLAAVAPGLLGDLVVCAPLVAREARAQGKREEAHWCHLVVHGILHLLGYDHAADRDAEAMEAREREILSALGLPDPYALPQVDD